MTMRWTSMVLAVSWFGACAAAWAQGPPPFAPEAPPSAPDLSAPPGPADCAAPPIIPPCPTLCGVIEPPCEPRPLNIQVGLEYLAWFTKGQRVPPLVTSGSLSDLAPAALGQPHTAVLYGGRDTGSLYHNGGLLTLGVGLTEDAAWSLEGSAFVLDRRSTSQAFASDGAAGTPVIGRPFFNLGTNNEDADPVAIPNVASGSIAIDTRSWLYGANLDGRWQFYGDDFNRVALLMGARYLALDESLNIHETSQDLPGQGVPGNSYLLEEDFGARNRFYGAEAGAAYELHFGPVVADLAGEAAFGRVHQTIHNNAFTSITEPNGIVTTSTDRALYIAPNNAGQFSRTRFAVVPEGRFKLGVDLNQYIRVTVGYTFLYLTEAARPADQINRNVNIQPVGTAAIFGPPLPPGIQSGGYWVQGVDAGLRFSF